MYSKADFENNAKRIRREWLRVLLIAGPFLAGAAAAFLLRVEIACTACVIIAGAALIFLWDMRLSPLYHYGSFLKEVTSGLQHRTAGALVSIGSDPAYQDGVNFYEVIINIYEDMAEDGERRFYLDSLKTIDPEMIGTDVVLTSHGSYILQAEPLAGAKA